MKLDIFSLPSTICFINKYVFPPKDVSIFTAFIVFLMVFGQSNYDFHDIEANDETLLYMLYASQVQFLPYVEQFIIEFSSCTFSLCFDRHTQKFSVTL